MILSTYFKHTLWSYLKQTDYKELTRRTAYVRQHYGKLGAHKLLTFLSQRRYARILCNKQRLAVPLTHIAVNYLPELIYNQYPKALTSYSTWQKAASARGKNARILPFKFWQRLPSQTKIKHKALMILSPKKRHRFAVMVDKGRLAYQASRILIDTSGFSIEDEHCNKLKGWAIMSITLNASAKPVIYCHDHQRAIMHHTTCLLFDSMYVIAPLLVKVNAKGHPAFIAAYSGHFNGKGRHVVYALKILQALGCNLSHCHVDLSDYAAVKGQTALYKEENNAIKLFHALDILKVLKPMNDLRQLDMVHLKQQLGMEHDASECRLTCQ